MIEKVITRTTQIVKKGSDKAATSTMHKIKQDFVRNPISDSFVPRPQPLSNAFIKMLKKATEGLSGQDEIIKATTKDTATTVIKIARQKDQNTRSPYSYALQKIAPLITKENKDIVLKLAQIKDADNSFVFNYNLHIIIKKLDAQNYPRIIKMAEVRDSNGKIIHNGLMILGDLRVINEIESKSRNISDPKIKKYINENNLLSFDREQLYTINDMVDIYNTFNKSYSHIGYATESTNCREYYKFIKNNQKTLNITAKKIIKSKDFANEARIERLKDYCIKNPNNEISDYFYNNYYLKSDMVSKKLKAQCENINKKFGTKIFLSANHKEDLEVLKYTKKELAEFLRASEGKAKMPPIIDFSTIKVDYVDNKKNLKKMWTIGYQVDSTREISINDASKFAIHKALRHELTHANQNAQKTNIFAKYNVPKIIALKNNEDGSFVPDMENCSLKQEFYNAGISEQHTMYAHTNLNEFIAVASEGDMSKYSSEFKQMLIDFGMPEWMFKMKSKDELFNEVFKSE